MPVDWLRAHMAMKPRLEAHEALLASQVAVIPHLKQSDVRRQTERWRMISSGLYHPEMNPLPAKSGVSVLRAGADVRMFLAMGQIFG